MTGLILSVEAPPEVPLDESLVVVLRLRNDGAAAEATSSRLNLLEGDLSVWVRPPGGSPERAEWPWPIDSALREVTLGPGDELVGSALLLPRPSRAPGTYAVVAEFTPQPGVVVRSASVDVRRSAPSDDAGRSRQRALEDPEVAQSICSMSVIGSAAAGLSLLAAGDESPVAQLLATTVTTVSDALPAAVQQATRESDGATVAAALAAVLPPGLFPGDERLFAARQAVGDSADSRVDALLTGEPVAAG